MNSPVDSLLNLPEITVEGSVHVTVHGGVHHAHKRQSLAKQKLWVLCASKYRT